MLFVYSGSAVCTLRVYTSCCFISMDQPNLDLFASARRCVFADDWQAHLRAICVRLLTQLQRRASEVCVCVCARVVQRPRRLQPAYLTFSVSRIACVQRAMMVSRERCGKLRTNTTFCCHNTSRQYGDYEFALVRLSPLMTTLVVQVEQWVQCLSVCHKRRSRVGPGGPDPTKIWLWGLIWHRPHENFTEINVISAKSDTRSGSLSLENVLNCEVSSASTQTPFGELTALPQTP